MGRAGESILFSKVADPKQAALQALLAEVEKRGSKVEQWQVQSSWPGREPARYATIAKEGTLRVSNHAPSRIVVDWKPGQTIDDMRKTLDANKLYSTGGIMDMLHHRQDLEQ